MYQQPERVKARQILVKLPADATRSRRPRRRPAPRRSARSWSTATRTSPRWPRSAARIRAPRQPAGTWAGWSAGSLEPALANAVFALAPNKVSEPIETKLGFHVMKVEEKQAAQDKKLADAESEIATTLYKQQQAKELAKAEADKALAAVKGGKTIPRALPCRIRKASRRSSASRRRPTRRRWRRAASRPGASRCPTWARRPS